MTEKPTFLKEFSSLSFAIKYQLTNIKIFIVFLQKYMKKIQYVVYLRPVLQLEYLVHRKE